MKKLIYAFLALIILQACSSDDGNPKVFLFLTQMEDDIRNEHWDFDYHADSTINEIVFTQWESSQTWQFEYDGTTKTINEITITEGETLITLELLYDVDGKLDLINEWRDEAKYSTLEYVYGSNGKIQTLTHNYLEWEETQVATLIWDGDNLASYETQGAAYEFTYDNKVNHLAKMEFFIPYLPINRGYSFGGMALSNKPLELMSKNNCTSVTIDYGDEWMEEISMNWVYAGDYPTTSRVVAGDSLSSRKIFLYSPSLPE